VVKKIPSFVPSQSTGLRLGPGCSHMGYGVAVYGWGKDLGVFLTCVKRSSLNTMSRGCLNPPPPSAGRVFYINLRTSNMDKEKEGKRRRGRRPSPLATPPITISPVASILHRSAAAAPDSPPPPPSIRLLVPRFSHCHPDSTPPLLLPLCPLADSYLGDAFETVILLYLCTIIPCPC
jgi:hypothetical protein